MAATALTTWLQLIGQKIVPGPSAAVLYTVEPVWASAFAWVYFGERFGPRGWAGAALLLAAALLSQWPPPRKSDGEAVTPRGHESTEAAWDGRGAGTG